MPDVKATRFASAVLALSLAFTIPVSGQEPDGGPIRRSLERETVRQLLAQAAQQTSNDEAPTDRSGRQNRRTNLLTLNQFGGQLVYVEDRSFRQTLARVTRASGQELVVAIGGVETRLPAGDILRVYVKGDSVRNGTLLGALIGGVLGPFGCDTSDCSVAGSVIVSGGFFGAVGAYIDSRKVGRTVIYEAP